MAQAYARDGIRVNGVVPGLVDTKLTKATTEILSALAGRSGQFRCVDWGNRTV